jgi:hypothetical protein
MIFWGFLSWFFVIVVILLALFAIYDVVKK